MKRFTIFLGVLISLAASRADAKASRTLMHTFQDGSVIVLVAIVDKVPAPRGVVRSSDPARQRTFSVSRQQFEQMWRTLESL